MKKVMLIGDSIRLGYQEALTKELEGEFDVWGPADNCRFAKYTLNEIPRFLAACGTPDIIHWNNGLWDTALVYEEDGAFTPVDEYLDYMAKILRELRKLTNKIVFATITPVKLPNPNQKNEIIEAYNARIKEFMEEEHILVNDLHDLVASHVDEYICEDHIHLSDLGKEACAKAVASYIRQVSCEEEL